MEKNAVTIRCYKERDWGDIFCYPKLAFLAAKVGFFIALSETEEVVGGG